MKCQCQTIIYFGIGNSRTPFIRFENNKSAWFNNNNAQFLAMTYLINFTLISIRSNGPVFVDNGEASVKSFLL